MRHPLQLHVAAQTCPGAQVTEGLVGTLLPRWVMPTCTMLRSCSRSDTSVLLLCWMCSSRKAGSRCWARAAAYRGHSLSMLLMVCTLMVCTFLQTTTALIRPYCCGMHGKRSFAPHNLSWLSSPAGSQLFHCHLLASVEPCLQDASGTRSRANLQLLRQILVRQVPPCCTNQAADRQCWRGQLAEDSGQDMLWQIQQ